MICIILPEQILLIQNEPVKQSAATVQGESGLGRVAVSPILFKKCKTSLTLIIFFYLPNRCPSDNKIKNIKLKKKDFKMLPFPI